MVARRQRGRQSRRWLSEVRKKWARRLVQRGSDAEMVWGAVAAYAIIALIAFAVHNGNPLTEYVKGDKGIEVVARSYLDVHGSWLAVLFGFLSLAVSFATRVSRDETTLLIAKQKARIRLLECFTPTRGLVGLVGKTSIYDSVIGMLTRARGVASRDLRPGPVRLRLLMCAPWLDYPGRRRLAQGADDYDDWGEEFSNLMNDITATKARTSELEFYYLPDEEIAGFNPLRGFVETIANYCASAEKGTRDPAELFRIIWGKTQEYAGLFETWADDSRRSVTVNEVKFTNIPFQMFIVDTDELNEVVVSFAGKQAIEDRERREPRGFHSIDPDVVDTFKKVFDAYVCEHTRMPLEPLHTSAVMDCHDAVGDHVVLEYLNRIHEMEVGAGVFSPAIANSSKFTSDVLAKILVPGQSVLDLGSGTGVHALVASSVLSEGTPGSSPSLVWALESSEDALPTLRKNCGSNITVRPWALLARVESPSGSTLMDCRDVSDRDTLIGGEIGLFEREDGDPKAELVPRSLNAAESASLPSFDVVVADLPYVDYRAEGSGARKLDAAFFDPGHFSHRSLFEAVAEGSFLRPEGMLITSFSTLGGPEDQARFERLIAGSRLQVVRRFSYYEQEYCWLVYCICRENRSRPEPFSWWKELHASWIRKPGGSQEEDASEKLDAALESIYSTDDT